MDSKTSMGILGFKDAFEGNYKYLVRNNVNDLEVLEKEFDDAYIVNDSFKKIVSEFVMAYDCADVLHSLVGKAAFLMAIAELSSKAKMEKYGNDGNLYMVMNLDTQEKQYFQAGSAFEAMSKFKYSMGVKNGKVKDIPIDKTTSGKCLSMTINGEVWSCVNRKPNGKW